MRYTRMSAPSSFAAFKYLSIARADTKTFDTITYSLLRSAFIASSKQSFAAFFAASGVQTYLSPCIKYSSFSKCLQPCFAASFLAMVDFDKQGRPGIMHNLGVF